MTSAAILRSTIERKLPLAFAPSKRIERETIPTGIEAVDAMTSGIPLSALTEICGSNLASSGKTSVLHSLLARASQKYFCALVDAGDSLDTASAENAGVDFSRLLWVRCGRSRQKMPPLEQAFKATDMLLQSGGFGLIVMDLSGVPDRVVRKVPLTSWFRFSRVVEKQNVALVVLQQRSHAASCAGLVLECKTTSAVWQGRLLTQLNVSAEVLRGRQKKPVRSAHPERPDFSLKSQWA